MHEKFKLGPCPEGVEPVPARNISGRLVQCRIFIDQLIRTFGPTPEGCQYLTELNWKTRDRNVIVTFDTASAKAVVYAMEVFGNLPVRWDAQAETMLARLQVQPAYREVSESSYI